MTEQQTQSPDQPPSSSSSSEQTTVDEEVEGAKDDIEVLLHEKDEAIKQFQVYTSH